MNEKALNAQINTLEHRLQTAMFPVAPRAEFISSLRNRLIDPVPMVLETSPERSLFGASVILVGFIVLIIAALFGIRWKMRRVARSR